MRPRPHITMKFLIQGNAEVWNNLNRHEPSVALEQAMAIITTYEEETIIIHRRRITITHVPDALCLTLPVLPELNTYRPYLVLGSGGSSTGSNDSTSHSSGGSVGYSSGGRASYRSGGR